MVKRHPDRAVYTVLAVMVGLGFVAGMIGQFNEGPWGGLPGWLADVTWFGFLLASLTMAVLSVYLLVAHLQCRRGRQTTPV